MKQPGFYEKAFTEKYNKYFMMLFRVAMVYLNNSMDSEDVCHDVFIKLMNKAPEFNDSEHEKRWLLRITVNRCKDKLKEAWRKKRTKMIDTAFTINNDDERELAEAVINLPPRIKATVHLYYYEGYKVREISEILKISISAVKMRLKKGRELLKLELEENDG